MAGEGFGIGEHLVRAGVLAQRGGVRRNQVARRLEILRTLGALDGDLAGIFRRMIRILPIAAQSGKENNWGLPSANQPGMGECRGNTATVSEARRVLSVMA